MLQAQRIAPGDPEVETVLGVLYNTSEDYGLAIACFETALQHHPHDYSLWNKVRRGAACTPSRC